MKAEDLMIGDWVCYDGDENHECPVRIDAINTEEAGVEGDYYDVWEPILLTPEILEKNGFKKETHFIDWKDRTLYKVGYDMYIIMNYYEDDNFTLCNIYDDSDEGAVVIDITSINYVHELQHALKLCKIDKEIIV